jgi:N-acyl-D-amino-acid deacylase
MSKAFANSNISRREFLATAAVAVPGASALAKPPGTERRGLHVYDDLMSDFMAEHKPPGAALAVARNGRLVYAKGFGYADLATKEPVKPESLFRIASISKPLTSAAIFRLAEGDRLSLNDPVLKYVRLEPVLAAGTSLDPRLRSVRIRHCLQHTGGWDWKKSFEPMSGQTAKEIARRLHIDVPIKAEQIIRYTLGKPLDFDPGIKMVYSNFGYCLLGRVIEAVSGQSYESYVTSEVLEPLGIYRMHIGKSTLRGRRTGEVVCYDSKKRIGPVVCGIPVGVEAPFPYAIELMEPNDSACGWIGSVVDLVRFGVAFDVYYNCTLLNPQSVRTMLARPDGPPGREADGKPKSTYYACGWDVQPADVAGKLTKWHLGKLSGTCGLLVCRADRIDWAALFNSDGDTESRNFAERLDPLLYHAADSVRNWPRIDLFDKYYSH